MQHSKRAQNEISHGKKLTQIGAESVWGWGTPAGEIRARRRAEWIAKEAMLKPGIRALEIGCGTGIFTTHFASTGADILAVDISEELLQKARACNLPPTVKFKCTPFENLSVDQPFDAIIGSSVLHHLEVESSLSRAYDLLRPGGMICFSEPNMLNPQIMLQKNIPWIKELLGDSPDETAFFRWQMASLLQESGFIEVQVTPIEWLHPLTHPKMIPTMQKIGMILEKIPLIKEFAGSLHIRAKRPD
jgi:2-polyprenyl-3-methyl-5-hydroxy-6-metoxy-1,4-benzoquinol methylase